MERGDFKINQKAKRWDQNYREYDPICFNLIKFTSYFLVKYRMTQYMSFQILNLFVKEF